MQSKYLRHTHGLKALALVGGFGLLTACPLDPSASGSGTDTNVGTTTGTTGDSSTETTGPDPTTTTGDAPTTTTGPDPTTTTTTTTDPTTTTTTGDVDGALCVALGGVDGVGELVADAVARVTQPRELPREAGR